jgi:hypothetical protein
VVVAVNVHLQQRARRRQAQEPAVAIVDFGPCRGQRPTT